MSIYFSFTEIQKFEISLFSTFRREFRDVKLQSLTHGLRDEVRRFRNSNRYLAAFDKLKTYSLTSGIQYY